MIDLFLATLTLVCGSILLSWLAKIHNLSRAPIFTMGPILFGIGAILYLPGSPLFIPSDGQFYLSWGQSLAASWSSGAVFPPEGTRFPVELWPGKGFWPFVIATITFLLGPTIATPIAVNVVFLLAMTVALQKAAFLISGHNHRWSPLLLIGSSPSLLLFGPSLLREAIFWFGVSIWVLALIYCWKWCFKQTLTLGVAASALLIAVRPDAGVVLSFAFLFAAIFVVVIGRLRVLLALPLLLLTVVALIWLLTVSLDVLRPGTSSEALASQAGSLAHPSVSTAFPPNHITDQYSRCQNVPDSEVLAAACQSLHNLPRVLFGPYLSEYQPDLIWVIAGTSGIHFLLIVGLSLAWLIGHNGSRLISIALVLVGAVSLLLFASILTNYGIVIRFRVATEIILMPTAIASMSNLIRTAFGSKGQVSDRGPE